MRLIDIKLAFRNVFRNTIRSRANILIIGICCCVILFIGGFYIYLFDDAKKSIIMEEGHLSIQSDKLIDNFKMIDSFLEKDARVLTVLPIFQLNGLAGFGDSSAIFSGTVVDYQREKIVKNFFNISYNDEENKISIGKILAKNLDVSVGDIVNFLIDFNGTSFEVGKIVSTVSDELDRFYVKMPFKLIQKNIDLKGASSIAVFLTNEKYILELQNKIELFLQSSALDCSVSRYDESGSYFTSVIDIYMTNFLFIIIIILITSFFSISNTLYISFMERLREIGTIRTFGVPKSGINKLLMYEALIMNLAGFFIGLMMTVIVMVFIQLSGGLNIPPPPTVDKGFRIFIRMDLSIIFFTLGGTLLTGMLSSAYTSTIANKMSIIDKIRSN